MTELDPDPNVAELRDRVSAFIQATVIPAEQRDDSEHALDESLRAELQDAARAAGLFAPHVSVSLGGLGLDTRGQAAVFEEAGYSLLGPQALNCAAPDEGNMHLLSVIATEQQRARYLAPLAAGAVRSCFAMTEPSVSVTTCPSHASPRRSAHFASTTGPRKPTSGPSPVAPCANVHASDRDRPASYPGFPGEPATPHHSRKGLTDEAFLRFRAADGHS